MWAVQQSPDHFLARDFFPFGAPDDVRRLADVDGDGRGDQPIVKLATSGRWSEAISALRVRGISTVCTTTRPS